MILGTCRYSAVKDYEPYQYHVRVSMFDSLEARRRLRDADVIRYLTSEKGFQCAALEDLDKLGSLARKQILSGKAIRNIEVRVKNSRGGNPYCPVGPGMDCELNDVQKTEILQEALKEITRRKALVNEHYQGMYAAATKAFPLAECMKTDAAR